FLDSPFLFGLMKNKRNVPSLKCENFRLTYSLLYEQTIGERSRDDKNPVPFCSEQLEYQRI
ncbi:hypothetical protein, partial [Brevibacillus sp. NRS-1366]|uniref:hypothetical protein n=1 Tax=Brevibacillus sp. NRS-1366 TaxID=3233899 RepID=UPI003D211764